MNGWTMLEERRWQSCAFPFMVMFQETNQAKPRKLLEQGPQDYPVTPLNSHLLLPKTLRHFSVKADAENWQSGIKEGSR